MNMDRMTEYAALLRDLEDLPPALAGTVDRAKAKRRRRRLRKRNMRSIRSRTKSAMKETAGSLRMK